MKKHTCTFLIVLTCMNCNAQDMRLTHLIKNQEKIDRFIFVTTKIPIQDLIELARQARIVKMTMILNGFNEDSSSGLESTKRTIANINTACCESDGPKWEIYPQLFDKFNIKEGPAFVISRRNPQSALDFAKVSGEMSVQNALKFIYAGAIDAKIKADAKLAYKEFKEND